VAFLAEVVIEVIVIPTVMPVVPTWTTVLVIVVLAGTWRKKVVPVLPIVMAFKPRWMTVMSTLVVRRRRTTAIY
jgi:hypothetical protein